GAELGADLLVFGVAADVLQIRIFGEPFKVAIAEAEGLVESVEGFFDAIGQRIAASQVIEDEGVGGPKMGQALIDLKSIAIATAPRVIVAQDLQCLDVARVSFDDAFDEPDLDIKIALLMAG